MHHDTISSGLKCTNAIPMIHRVLLENKLQSVYRVTKLPRKNNKFVICNMSHVTCNMSHVTCSM